MSLTAGIRLGPYEITAPIGEGGMRAVYRARDSRVGRDVAIKVSAERFTERFEREDRAIAALNHTTSAGTGGRGAGIQSATAP
jgi:serine/threonine protein kinase